MSGGGAAAYLVVLVTLRSAEAAAKLARALVEEHLAACGNVVESIRSIYRWQGRVQDEPEALLILKTTAEKLQALKDRVIELHSYEVPEVIALPLSDGHQPYLEWIGSCVAPES